MKKMFLMLALVIATTVFAQDPPKTLTSPPAGSIAIDENTSIYDVTGKKITLKEFGELMATKKYGLDKPIVENGKLKEVRLIVAKDGMEKGKIPASTITPGKDFQLPSYDDKIGKEAPAFKALGLDGEEYDLSALKGKIVVLNFWFIECAPCREEIPHLNNLVKKYENNKDVVFIAVAPNDPEKVAAFIEKTPFNYSLLTSAQKVISDYNVKAFPTHFVINKEGKYNFFQIGGAEIEKVLDEQIQKALNN